VIILLASVSSFASSFCMGHTYLPCHILDVAFLKLRNSMDYVDKIGGSWLQAIIAFGYLNE
jgi:hypothetical protein